MSALMKCMEHGGSPEQEAALAVIGFAACAAPYSDLTVEERLYAAGVTASLLSAAEAGGFTARDEFLNLVATGRMTPILEAHCFDVVLCLGGAAECFQVLELATTPADQMGARQ